MHTKLHFGIIVIALFNTSYKAQTHDAEAQDNRECVKVVCGGAGLMFGLQALVTGASSAYLNLSQSTAMTTLVVAQIPSIAVTVSMPVIVAAGFVVVTSLVVVGFSIQYLCS